VARSAVVPASWVLLCRSCSRSLKVCASILVDPCSGPRLGKPSPKTSRCAIRDPQPSLLTLSLSGRFSEQLELKNKHVHQCCSRDSGGDATLESSLGTASSRPTWANIQTAKKTSVKPRIHNDHAFPFPARHQSFAQSRTTAFFLRIGFALVRPIWSSGGKGTKERNTVILTTSHTIFCDD
jgi:hypothetical protein